MDLQDEKIGPWLLAMGVAFIGRLAFHARQVQAGKRKPWGWVLFWEIPIAILMGFVSYSACVYFRLPTEVAVGAISAVAYLGPHLLDVALARWAGTKVQD